MAETRAPGPRVSAGVILVDREGRVLLQHRDDDPAIMYPGHWGITGGAAEAGETPEQAARREVLEETGLTLGRLRPFRAYYFQDAPSNGKRAKSRPVEYALYLFHAPCDTPAEALVCGEGRELRFCSRDEVAAMDVAYNHRDVLADFFASPAFGRYASATAFEQDDGAEGGSDPVAVFLAALDAGDPWFDALMRSIAAWEQPSEVVDGRRFDYLLAGEAFDWLLLAERLLEAAGQRIPAADIERLLFESRPPAGAATEGPAPMISDERLRELIGDTKHRAHLNYLYGVTVEEALQYAVELDLQKERRTGNIKDARADDDATDPVFTRVYGRTRSDLLAEYREVTGAPGTPHMALSEWRAFLYWLFKYRVAHQEPARVASDTRKALAQLSSMAAARARVAASLAGAGARDEAG